MLRISAFVLRISLSLEVDAATTTVIPAPSIRIVVCAAPPVSVLSTEEESGQSDGWSNYIEFYGARLDTKAGCFSSPCLRQWSFHISLHSVGCPVSRAKRQLQRWRFEIFDQSASAYLLLGDNTAAQSWVWSRLNFSVPAVILRGFLQTGRRKSALLQILRWTTAIWIMSR